MGKAPAFQWYPNDYIRDTRILSLSARGAWSDMLNFMWYSEDRGILTGTYEQFARMLSCSVDEIKSILQELNVTKVADVTNGNEFVTVKNRRMVRDEKERKSTRMRVQKHRNAKCNDISNDDVTPPSSSSSSSSSLKKESIKKEKIEFQQNHFINIPAELKTKWEQIAPGISIASELIKAEAWVLSNPKLRKSNWSRFLTNWMIRAQDGLTKYGGINGNSTGYRKQDTSKPLPTGFEEDLRELQRKERAWLEKRKATAQNTTSNQNPQNSG